jgi:glucokinase
MKPFADHPVPEAGFDEPVLAGEYVLVGDIGGTNARFALVKPGSVTLSHILTLETADFPGIEAAIQCYSRQMGVSGIHRACLALACPVTDDDIVMTNNHWVFHRQQLMNHLGLQQLKLVNDFTAMALGMLQVPGQDLVDVHIGHTAVCHSQAEGHWYEQGTRLVIGPGTGLGVSGLVPVQGGWVPLSGEGGHVSFAPTSAAEYAILQGMQQRYGRVSVERLLSGQGLLDMYQILAQIHGLDAECATPASISQQAQQDEHSLGRRTLTHFFEILGAVVGDQALTLGARGGVYLCGGILPRVKELFLASQFHAAMINKGRFQHYLEDVPVWLCVADNPGLLGAAAALDNSEVHG